MGAFDTRVHSLRQAEIVGGESDASHAMGWGNWVMQVIFSRLTPHGGCEKALRRSVNGLALVPFRDRRDHRGR